VLDDPDVKTTTCHHCKLGSGCAGPQRGVVWKGDCAGGKNRRAVNAEKNDSAVWIRPFPRVARVPPHVAA
jgi:hypothetical protein